MVPARTDRGMQFNEGDGIGEGQSNKKRPVARLGSRQINKRHRAPAYWMSVLTNCLRDDKRCTRRKAADDHGLPCTAEGPSCGELALDIPEDQKGQEREDY